MKIPSRLAISWAEIILLVLLVIGGMGIWEVVNNMINANNSGSEPRLETFLADKNIPVLEANLKGEQDSLSAALKEQHDLQVTQARLEVEQQTLLADYPQLANLTGPSRSRLPADTVDTFLAIQLEEETASQLMDDINNQVVGLIEASVVLSSTMETLPATSVELQTAKLRKEVLDTQVAALTEALSAQRLVLAEKTAQSNAMQTLYPDLKLYSSQPASGLSSDARRSYWELIQTQRQTNQLLSSNTMIISDAESLVRGYNISLAATRAEASSNFGTAQRKYEIRQRWIILGLAISLNVLYLALAYGLISRFRLSKFPIHPELLIGFAAALIAVLTGYQIFGLLGAAVSGLLCLAGVMYYLSSYSHASPPEQNTERGGAL